MILDSGRRDVVRKENREEMNIQHIKFMYDTYRHNSVLRKMRDFGRRLSFGVRACLGHI